jgi:hypothetical protein
MFSFFERGSGGGEGDLSYRVGISKSKERWEHNGAHDLCKRTPHKGPPHPAHPQQASVVVPYTAKSTYVIATKTATSIVVVVVVRSGLLLLLLLLLRWWGCNCDVVETKHHDSHL